MGQAKHNPMSQQFAGRYPEEILTCGTLVYEKPAHEWQREHPEWKEVAGEPGAFIDVNTGEKCPPELVMVTLMLTVQRVEPSALNPGRPDKWPTSGVIPLGPILFVDQKGEAMEATMTLANFRQLTPVNGKVRKDDNPAPPGAELLIADAAAEEAFADKPKEEPEN